MAALVQGLDNYTPRNVGENGNVQLGWSNNIMEKIVQLHFQLVRTSNHTEFEQQYNQILSSFIGKENDLINEFIIAYKLAGFTRDIIKGKGEQQLSFTLIWCLWNHYPTLAIHTISTLFEVRDVNGNNIHPYGSWKDAKYLCDFVKNKIKSEEHEIIDYIIKLAVDKIKKDEINFTNNRPISLAAKWLPREKSKRFGWIFNKFAISLHPEFVYPRIQDIDRHYNSVKKCKTIARKLLSKLNKYIDTTQIKQCSKNWKNIDFNNVTSCTMRKQKNAFLNLKKYRKTLVKKTDEQDRIDCATNFRTHIELSKNGSEEHKVHGKRCMVYDLVKDAVSARDSNNQTVIDTVNEQWKSNATNNNGLKNIIPMADTSYSMHCDNFIPLYNSIGLSIRVSELCNESFKDRVMIFDSTPRWCNLSNAKDFVDKVHILNSCSSGLNTNFYKALNMILDVIVQNSIPPNEVENMVLAIFSDMQIDAANRGGMQMNTLYENMEVMFRDAGMNSIFNMPYKPPHILFWNLRKTNGFPTFSSQENVTMLSGYNSTLLNIFCEKGVEELKKVTPFVMLENLLNQERYDTLESAVINLLEQ